MCSAPAWLGSQRPLCCALNPLRYGGRTCACLRGGRAPVVAALHHCHLHLDCGQTPPTVPRLACEQHRPRLVCKIDRHVWPSMQFEKHAHDGQVDSQAVQGPAARQSSPAWGRGPPPADLNGLRSPPSPPAALLEARHGEGRVGEEGKLANACSRAVDAVIIQPLPTSIVVLHACR